MSTKLKSWFFIGLIFAAGIVTGVALTVALSPHFGPPGAQQMKARWMMYLTRQLNLTADQQAKIDPILNDAENQMQAARKDNMDRVSQIIKKTNDQISAILTPEQKATLDKMSEEMDKRRDRMFPGGHMHGWGGPHGAGGPNGPGGPPPSDH